MKPRLSLLVFSLLLAATAFGTLRLAASTPALAAGACSSFLPRPPFAGPHELVFYGHVKSVVKKGGRFQMQVDPAYWLSGVTASRAALKATGSSDVPNDYFIVDEMHGLLTYVVPASARVTVMTTGPRATAISVSELAQVVKGRNPRHRQLFERTAGFWVRVVSDTVVSLDQQYQP